MCALIGDCSICYLALLSDIKWELNVQQLHPAREHGENRYSGQRSWVNENKRTQLLEGVRPMPRQQSQGKAYSYDKTQSVSLISFSVQKAR